MWPCGSGCETTLWPKFPGLAPTYLVISLIFIAISEYTLTSVRLKECHVFGVSSVKVWRLRRRVGPLLACCAISKSRCTLCRDQAHRLSVDRKSTRLNSSHEWI